MSNISITPEGVVSKDGKELGTIKDGVLYHKDAISGPVKGQIRKVYGSLDLDFEANQTNDEDTSRKGIKAEGKPLTNEEILTLFISSGLGIKDIAVSNDELLKLAKSRGFSLEATPAPHEPVINGEVIQRRALSAVMERVKAGKIPAPPPPGPNGDKEPAFIRWFKENATAEEFEEQYSGRSYTL